MMKPIKILASCIAILMGANLLAYADTAQPTPATQPAAAAQPTGPDHPLDALLPDEIASVVALLKASGNADDNTVYPAITLKPGDKQAMWDWTPGTPYTRSAFVVMRRDMITYEAVVDITNQKVVSVTPKAGAQPMIMDFEWLRARDALIADSRFKDAIAKRKLNAADVFCTPNSAGAFPGDGLDGKRVLKVPCFTSTNAPSPYAGRPIEGLMGIVDVDSGAVLDVIDNGEVAMPAMPDGWGDSLPKPGPAMKPVAITAPNGTNITLDGNLNVKWENWSLHLRPDKRAGLIVNLVRFNDGTQWRKIAYQLNLSEAFVPYMDADPTWNYRTFMDIGEYGFGYMISSLKPGVDCPVASYILDVTLPNDIGGTFTRPDALCIFERATGDPAWRHYTAADKTIAGVPQSELVIRHIPTLGNYDYVVDYVFTPQGVIKVRVGATGFDAIRSTTAKTSTDADSIGATANGSLIAPYTIAPNHDHFFSLRMDLDVDGGKNVLERDSIVPSSIANSKTRKSLWTVQTDRYAAEGPIAMDHQSAGESWRIVNPNVKTGLGYNPGYDIDLGHSTTSALDRADPPQKRAGFTAFGLWATQYADGEDWAAGLYPNQSTQDEGLPKFVAQKRSIKNEDIVLWATMGFHHVPHPEDFPLLPTVWHEVSLRPAFFFDRDPSLTFNPGALPLPQPDTAN